METKELKDREVFKRNGKLTNEILDTIKHHLYVCLIDSKALESHILSRDFFFKTIRLEYNISK